MALKFKKPSGSSLQNIKTIYLGTGSGLRRIGEVLWLQNGTLYKPYALTYNIVSQITGGALEDDTPWEFGTNGQYKIVPNTGHALPVTGTIEVTNATLGGYSEETGVISLINPVAGSTDVTITATCELLKYKITSVNLNSSCTTDPSASEMLGYEMSYGTSYTFTIIPNSGKLLPALSGIAVVGASVQSYSRTTGVVVLNNPTGNISINITCPTGYTITPNVTNGTCSPTSTTVASGGSTTFTITPNSGYNLPEQITINGTSGASGTGAAVWTWKQSTGVITLNNITGSVVINVGCVPQAALEAPTISLSGKILSIVDNDGNATSFDIYVDGVYEANIYKQS